MHLAAAVVAVAVAAVTAVVLRSSSQPMDVAGAVDITVGPTDSLDSLLPSALLVNEPRLFERRDAVFRAGAAPRLLNLTLDSVHHLIASLDQKAGEAHLTTSRAGPPQTCRDGGAACLESATAAGATLIVNGAELLTPSLHGLVTAWRNLLGLFVSANLYATPRGEQGFLYHSDKTDVVVLQLEGAKLWDICGRALPKLEDPNAGEIQHFAEGDVPDVTLGTRSFNLKLADLMASCHPIELRAGDTLYLPAGFVHRARATLGDASLHVSVGIARTHHFLAWGGLLARMLDVARKQQQPPAAVAVDDVFGSWLYDVFASDEELAVLPRVFSTPRQYNVLVRDDAPTERKQLAALRSEYADRIGPLLRRWAWRDVKAAQLSPHVAQVLQGRIGDLGGSIVGSDALLWQVIEEVHALMRRSMEPPPFPGTEEALRYMREIKNTSGHDGDASASMASGAGGPQATGHDPKREPETLRPSKLARKRRTSKKKNQKRDTDGSGGGG